jgi:AcrR family transcriptional regulator
MMAARPRRSLAPAPRRVAGQGARLAHVQELQRTRLTAALIAVVESGETPRPTVSQIISRARVSRKTFYDLFSDREDCFLAAYEETFARARAAATQAYQQQATWRDGVRAALGCLLALMDEQPGLARLCIIHSSAAGERVQLRREELMAQLADTVDLGRGASTAASDLPRMTAEGIVGGVQAVIRRRLLRNDRGTLQELLGPLMSMIVLPYLGPQAACEERSTPSERQGAAAVRPPGRSSDPLSGLSIRLTYRTVRVLVAIGDQPHSSNREVAMHAGIADQGQVSKLLARLAGLGLIENLGQGQPKGGSNAWRLTVSGDRLERATRPRLI